MDVEGKDLDSKEEKPTCDTSTPSIEILKETKPSENISIPKPVDSEVNATIKAAESEKVFQDDVKVEQLKITEEVKNDPKPLSGKFEEIKERSLLKNKSDIFSLNENQNLPCTIFSVGGAPSKTIHKPIITSSSSSADTRNPVTGIGVCSKDEYKMKPLKRKDGNPLLGVGYKDDEDFYNTAPTNRIPPGGHSKGLW